MKRIFSILVMSVFLIGCTGVDSGYTGVKIEMGGKTDMNQVYPEGLYSGISWMWNKMVEYETKEQTVTFSDVYLDKDGLKVPIDAVVYFRAQSSSVNKLHKEIGRDYINRKILPNINAAMKAVIPQYRALELNSVYREEADAKLAEYLKKRFPEFYVDFIGVNITKVDIPSQISNQIVEKQVQDERNALAEKKELEQKNLAAAEVAKAKGAYEASEYERKTKANLSSPQLLEFYKAETERIWAENGVSPYGSNNVFGNSGVFKGYSK